MTLKEKLYIVIFEADTKAGKFFDLALIFTVFLSILFVMLETVEQLAFDYQTLFISMEWVFTILFSIELLFRLYCCDSKKKYLFSFYGLVDILSVLPTYVMLFMTGAGAQGFLIVRSFRLLRIFRILKLKNYTNAGKKISSALNASFPKIIVFMGFTLTVVTIIGSLMYLIESKESGFTSIPKSVYWAIVTMTTVGYGQITPQTPLGQSLASILMLTGYVIIAVPTGLVTAEFINQKDKPRCPHCKKEI